MAKGLNFKPSFHSSYPTPLHERPIFQYLIIVLICLTLLVSIMALVNTYQLKKFAIPTAVNINEFLKKLTSHDEMKSYIGVAPLNVVQISNNNFANLQAQINGLDVSYLGNFIIQYPDKIIIYDYQNDKIRGAVDLQQLQQAKLPNDLLEKLNKHPELKGLESQQPIGGQFDEASLNTLKQQFPDVYANAKVGDYLLRYQTKLVIYDYNQDKIVNAVDLSG